MPQAASPSPPPYPIEEVLEAWHTNNRINLFLIDKISSEGMRCTLSTRGGRDVSRQFAHLHNVRVWQLEKRAKELVGELEVFATEVHPSKTQLKKALIASGKAVSTFLTDLVDGKTRRRGFKKGIATTLGYFICHESHHRGNILLTLKQSGHNLAKADQYAIWNWDKI